MRNHYFSKELIEQSIGEEIGSEYYSALDHIAKDLLLREGHNHIIGRISGYPNPIGKSDEIFRDLYYRLKCEMQPRNEMYKIAFQLEEDKDHNNYLLSCHTADNKKILWQEKLEKTSIDNIFSRF